MLAPTPNPDALSCIQCRMPAIRPAQESVMRLSRRSLFLATASAAAASNGLAKGLAGSRKQIEAARAVMRGVIAATPVTGLSIAVTRGADLLWSECFGLAN